MLWQVVRCTAAAALIVCLRAAVDDPWLARVSVAMTTQEKRGYAGLGSDKERMEFRAAFWADKTLTEAEFLARTEYIDTAFGSGKPGSGANTDRGRVYLANGAPDSTHKVPASRIFHPCEVWFYDSLPKTGSKSRAQVLFYRKRGVGDYKLYSPTLDTIRALLIPQQGTRGMFGANDIITAADIRDRLNTAPGEEEIVEAALGVARGVTGSGNDEILALAASPRDMLRRDQRKLRPDVHSRIEIGTRPEVRVLQFWADENTPVTDVQVRARAAASVGLLIESRGRVLERSSVPLNFSRTGDVLYTQRFFLLPGSYRLVIEADAARHVELLHVADRSAGMTGGTLEERPGDKVIRITPDPRTADARDTLRRQREQAQ